MPAPKYARPGSPRAGFVRSLRLEALLAVHRTLVAGETGVSPGNLRRVQNWVGGGETPRTADYVPPPWQVMQLCVTGS